MNKYLKGLINSIVHLATGFVGGLCALSFLALGFLFFPSLVVITDRILIEHQGYSGVGVFEGVADGIAYFIIGFVPLGFLFGALALFVFCMFKTLKAMMSFDIEKIVNAIRADSAKARKLRKEAKNG